MPNANVNEKKLEISELELLILMEMGFFSSLRKKKIRFNLRPFSNPVHLQKKSELKKEKLVDLHLEIAKKVDELIERNERKLTVQQPEYFSKLPRSSCSTVRL